MTYERVQRGGSDVDWIGPALETVRDGSPFVAGGMFVAFLAGILIREIRRHHAAEVALWSDRYTELRERCTTLQARDDEHLKAWLEAERRYSELVRVSRAVASEAGPP